MPDPSLTFHQAVNAPETGEAFLILLTLDHDTLDEPLRFTSDGVDTESRGNTYIAFPFQISLPPSSKDQPPKMQLTIDNVDRQIVQTIREIQSAPSITVEVVLASTPDTVEVTLPDFILLNASYDRLTVQGDLVLELLEREPFPADTYNPANFPGLF